MDKQNPKFYMEFHCIIHQQSLYGKNLKSEYVMKVVVLVVTYFDFMDSIIASFNAFVSN
jgi:hypothetical protein